MTTIRAYLVDIKYKIERNISIILICRDENGKLITIRDYYRPNFFILPKPHADIMKLRTHLSKIKIDDKNYVTSTEIVTKKMNNKASSFIHVFTSRPDTINLIKNNISELEDVTNIFEDDISLTRKYMIENDLTPYSLFEAEVVENQENQYYKLVKILHKDITFMEPQVLSVHALVDDFDKKTILAIACSSNYEDVIFTTQPITSKLDYIIETSNEDDLLNRFRHFVIRNRPDIILFENNDFGLKQIISRAINHNIDMNINMDGTRPYMNNITKRYRTVGINEVFIDKILENFFEKRDGNINLANSNLNGNNGIKNKFKNNITVGKIIEENDSNDHMINSIFEKSQLNLMIFNSVYDNLTEIMKYCSLRFTDMFNFALNTLLEWILIQQSVSQNHIVLNKDKILHSEIKKKKHIDIMDTLPGIYNNVSVLDLTPIYPEIIIKNNISPETLNLSHQERVSQDEAILPATLNEIGDRIERLKKAIENVPNDNLERRHDILEKIFYGFYHYLTNKQMRWSSDDMLAIINQNIKNSITNIINHINKKDSVIYTDFSEMFVELKETDKEMLKSLKENIAESRNIFSKQVSKRAFFLPHLDSFDISKRLAVLNDTNTFTARNLLRRSQPKFIQNVIKKTIKMTLIDQPKEKIIEELHTELELLKSGNVPKQDITTHVKLSRTITSYHTNTIQGKIIERIKNSGEDIQKGNQISFIITKGDEAISKRARLPFEVKENEYDYDYYSKKLLLPAIEDILALKGISVEEIILGNTQSNLDEF